jgi:hypothetical protein
MFFLFFFVPNGVLQHPNSGVYNEKQKTRRKPAEYRACITLFWIAERVLRSLFITV